MVSRIESGDRWTADEGEVDLDKERLHGREPRGEKEACGPFVTFFPDTLASLRCSPERALFVGRIRRRGGTTDTAQTRGAEV